MALSVVVLPVGAKQAPAGADRPSGSEAGAGVVPSQAEPPGTDRGVEVTVKIDFLTFTTRKTLGDIVDAIYTLIGSVPVGLPYGFNSYHRQLVGEAGIRIGYSETREDVCVSIPGEACALIGEERLVQLVSGLAGRASRCDVAWDGCDFTPGMLDRAWNAGNVNTRVRRDGDSYQYMRNGGGNSTLYMGSKQSETRLVCYDKRGPTRLELRLRGARAATFFSKLQVAGAGKLPQLGLGVVVAHADFVQCKTSDSNVSRARRLRWWAKFTGEAAKLRLTPPTPAPTIERAERHVRNQAAMVATYVEICTKRGRDRQDTIEELLAHGSYRMCDRHLALIAMAST